MARILLGAVICSLFVAAQCIYSANDDVVTLTSQNFQREVVNSDSLWLVEFYAPWCGHCQRLTPEWKKAATALKGVVKVGAVDCDEHKTLGGQYEIQGFPTIKIFGANKRKPDDYQGGRSSDAIVDGALNALRSLVKSRLNGGAGGGSGSYDSGKQNEYLQQLYQLQQYQLLKQKQQQLQQQQEYQQLQQQQYRQPQRQQYQDSDEQDEPRQKRPRKQKKGPRKQKKGQCSKQSGKRQRGRGRQSGRKRSQEGSGYE